MFLFLILITSFIGCKPEDKTISQNEFSNEWILSEFFQSSDSRIEIIGNPQLIKCKYGEAMLFDGHSDGILLNVRPLSGLSRFTIEAIIRPDSYGNYEQRFLHCGTVDGDRLLLEIRTTENSWFFDSFLKTTDEQKALVDESLLHPLNQWCHVAFVVEKERQTTYVNGKQEVNSFLNFTPINDGACSIGTRQNEIAWFKGAIFKIKFSPNVVNPSDFMNY